ncbi:MULTISPECIES: DUF2589 domain-containing protein [Rheinheimera]|uniref:DUF2589 domain-containing protein n=1 Tax=Rheinheimera nanhaiensis E407-8 TaxID=562729 RepID=I1DTW0_9GAMM|nr:MULTISPECIES: DUF2589 domain-containing protein [Rheinheimera]GAB57488.1 hypothetical protein RNAN_0456 [Rheinheimera nanhaiensis E407-8]
MPNLVQELNSLDFSVYIGGPMQAAVQAQHAASMSQVSFIQAVGFEENGGNKTLRYVDFEFKKSVPNPHFGKSAQQLQDEGLPANAGDNQFDQQDVAIKVPFLTMLTIPALRIEELTIDFHAKLTSTETANVSSEFAASAELGINYKIVNFKASASYKRSSTRGVSVEKTYNLGVKVTALNDEIPAGLDRILTMLEDSIVSA